eukprot:3640108-Rhodomonas_salina.1
MALAPLVLAPSGLRVCLPGGALADVRRSIVCARGTRTDGTRTCGRESLTACVRRCSITYVLKKQSDCSPPPSRRGSESSVVTARSAPRSCEIKRTRTV